MSWFIALFHIFQKEKYSGSIVFRKIYSTCREKNMEFYKRDFINFYRSNFHKFEKDYESSWVSFEVKLHILKMFIHIPIGNNVRSIFAFLAKIIWKSGCCQINLLRDKKNIEPKNLVLLIYSSFLGI